MVVYTSVFTTIFYLRCSMASYDDLISSIVNNPNNAQNTPTQPNTFENQLNQLKQTDDYLAGSKAQNNLIDYTLGAGSTLASSVGSLGYLGGPIGEAIVTKPLEYIAEGLQNLKSDGAKLRANTVARRAANLEAKNQAQYTADLASGKSSTQASLAKVGRDFTNFFSARSSGDLGMVAAESAGSLAGSFIGGGGLGKALSWGAKGIMAAKATKALAPRLKAYEASIQQLNNEKALLEKTIQESPTLDSVGREKLLQQIAEKDRLIQTAQAEAQQAQKALLEEDTFYNGLKAQQADENLAAMQAERAQLNNRLNQSTLGSKYDDAVAKVKQAETESQAANAALSEEDTFFNGLKAQKADKALETAKVEQKTIADQIPENKLKQVNAELDIKQAVKDKLTKRVESRVNKAANKFGEETGGLLTNFAYGMQAGSDAVKDLDLDNLTEEDLNNSPEYKRFKQEYLNKGLSEQEASAKAKEDLKSYIANTVKYGTGLWEAFVSKVMGTAKLEGKGLSGLLRTKPVHMAADTFKETAEEIGQGIGENTGAQWGKKQIDNDVSLTDNLGEAIAENAFGIPAGMAITKAGAIGLKSTASAAKLPKWGVAAGISAGSLTKQGIDKAVGAFKGLRSEKAVNRVVNPTGNVEKENKVFNKLDDSIKEVLKRDEIVDNETKETLSNIDDKELQEQVLGKNTTNQHQQLYALHESVKKDASILNNKDSSEEAKETAYQNMTVKLAALHNIAASLNVKANQSSEDKTKLLKYAFNKKAREIIDTSPEYRKRVIDEINNANLSKEESQIALNNLTFADLVIDSQVEENIKNNQSIANEIEALKKVVTKISDTPSFANDPRAEEIKAKAKIYEAVNDILQGNAEYISSWVDKNKKYYSEDSVDTEGKSEQDYLYTKMLNDVVDMSGKHLSLKGYVLNMAKIMASNAEDKAKSNGIEANLANLLRFVQNQDNKVADMQQAADAWEQSAQDPNKPIPFNKGNNYFNNNTYGMLARAKAEQEVMHTTYNSLQKVAKAVLGISASEVSDTGNKGNKPVTGNKPKSTGSGNKGTGHKPRKNIYKQNKESIAQNIKAFNSKGSEGPILEDNDNNEYSHVHTESAPITISYNGTIRQITPHKNWTDSNRQGIKNSTNAYSILKSIFNLLGANLATPENKKALEDLGLRLKLQSGYIYRLKDLFQLDDTDPLANVPLFSANYNYDAGYYKGKKEGEPNPINVQRGYEALALIRGLMANPIEDSKVSEQSKKALQQALGTKKNISYAVVGMPRLDFGGRQYTGGLLAQSFMSMGKALTSVGAKLRIATQAGAARAFALGHDYVDVYQYKPVNKTDDGDIGNKKARELQGTDLVTKDNAHPLDLVFLFHNPADQDPTSKAAVEQLTNSDSTGDNVKVINLYNHPDLAHLTGDEFIQAVADIVSKQSPENVHNELTPMTANFVNEFYKRLENSEEVEETGSTGTGDNKGTGNGEDENTGEDKSGKKQTVQQKALTNLGNLIKENKDKDMTSLSKQALNKLINNLLSLRDTAGTLASFYDQDLKPLMVKALYAYLSSVTSFTGKSKAQEKIKDFLDNILIPQLIAQIANGTTTISPEALDLLKLYKPDVLNSTEGQAAEDVIEQDAEDAAGQLSNPNLAEAIQQAKKEQAETYTKEGKPASFNGFELSDTLKKAAKGKDWNQVNKLNKGRVTFLQAAKVDNLADIKDDSNKTVSKLKDKAKSLTSNMLKNIQELFNKYNSGDITDQKAFLDFIISPISTFFTFNEDGSIEWAKDINGTSIEESLQQAYVYAMLKAGTRTYNSVVSLYLDNTDIETLSFENIYENQDAPIDDRRLLLDSEYGSTHLITTNVLGQTIANALKAFLPALYNGKLPMQSTNGAIDAMSSSLMSSSRATEADIDNDSFALNKFNLSNKNDIATGANGFSITLHMQDGTTNESVAVNLPIRTNKYKNVINNIEKALYQNNSDSFDSLVLTDEEAKDIDSLPVSSHLNHHNEASLTTLQKKAIKADRSQKHIMTPFGKVIAAIKKEVYIRCCSVDNNEYVNQHANESVIARREALGREFEYVVDRNQQLDTDKKGLYYNHEMTSVSRMNSNDYLSPRNSKTVRESISPISYKVPSDTPRLNLWKRMVVQGFGGKVQNTDDVQIQDQLNPLMNLYQNDHNVRRYAELCSKKELTAAEADEVSDLFEKVQKKVEQALGSMTEDSHTPLYIHAYTDYFRFIYNPKDMVSSLYGEADGIANGIFFSKIMDGSLSFIINGKEMTQEDIDKAKAEIDNLARVGMFIGISSSSFYKEAAERINTALVQNGKVIDTYTQIANEFSNELNSKEGPLSYKGLQDNFGLGENPNTTPTYYDKSRPQGERRVQGEFTNDTIHKNVVDAFNAVLQALGVKYVNGVYEALRIFAKKPTTKANYQAQEHSIAVELSKQVANLLEQKLNGYPSTVTIDGQKLTRRISWFTYAINPNLNLDSISFDNAEDRDRLEQDIKLYRAIETLNCFQQSVDISPKNKGEKPIHFDASYDPNAFNSPALLKNPKNEKNLNVYNDLMQQNNGRFVKNLQLGLINNFKKVIDSSLGQEVQDATGDMALASGYICAVYKSMLAKRFKDKLEALGVFNKLALSDQPEKQVVQLMHYANKYIPKKEVIQIIREVLAKSGAITTNRAGTKIFNYKQTLNSQETSDPYVINTTKGKNMFSTEKTREYQDPGVAVAPTSTISIGDGETMNRFIVEVLKPLGISYNDVFDGLNMDPFNHYKVGSQLNKIAAEQALNNSPVELLYNAYKNIRDNIKAEDLLFNTPEHLTPNSESHWDELGKRPDDLLGQKDGISDPNSAYAALEHRLEARAERTRKLNQALKSHYVPYSCCQYAFSPDSGYTKKAWIKFEGKVHQIKDITDAHLLSNYINLVANYLNAPTANKQAYKDLIKDFLVKNKLLEDSYKYNDMAEDTVDTALEKEVARQTNQHAVETYIWDGIDKSDYVVRNWLKKMCRALGVTGKTVLINDPDLANKLAARYSAKYNFHIDLTKNAVTVPDTINRQDVMIILNPFNIKYTAHEVTHAMADRIIRERLEKLDPDTQEKIRTWLLDMNDGSFKNEPNLPKNSFGDLLRVLKRYIHDFKMDNGITRYDEAANLYEVVKEAFAQTVASTSEDQNKIANHKLQTDTSKLNKKGEPYTKPGRDQSLANKVSNVLSKLKQAFLKFFGLSTEDQYSKIFGDGNYTYRNAAMVFFSQMSVEKAQADKENKQQNQNKVNTITDTVSFANMPESLTLYRLNAYIKQKQQDPKFANLVKAYSFSKPNTGDIATDYATSGINVLEDIPLIATLDTIVKGNYLPSKTRLKINNLYSDFIKSDKLSQLPANKAALITGNILDMFENHKSTTAGLTNFIYLGLTDPEVKSVLQSIKESKLGKFNGNYKIDNWLSDKITDVYNQLFLNSNNISEALEASLAKGIASKAIIETLDKVADAESFATSKANSILSVLANKAIDVSGKVIDKASKAVNAPTGMKVATTLRTLADVTASKDVDEYSPRARVLNDINAFLGAGTPHVVQELVRDMVGMDYHNFPVYAMLKKVTATLDRESLQRSKGIPDLLRKKFNHITKEDEAMIAKHYLKLDLTTLLDGSNIHELANTIKDPSNEIAQYEQGLTRYQIRKAKQLANYMVTGKSREMMLRNAHAIAASLHKPLDNTSYKKAMVPQIDKLVSCYAIQQLAEADRNKLAKFIQNNIEGMSALADIHDSIKRSELKKLPNKFNYYKGYIPTSFKNQVNYKAVGSLDAVHEAELQGWELVSKLPKVGTAGETYILRSALPDVNFHKGIIQTNSTKIYGTNERGNSVATLLKPLTRSQYIYNPDNGVSDYEPIPTFKPNGAIDSYDRPTPLSDDLFDWSGLDALGKWSANEFIESASKSFNLETIALTKKVYDEDVKMYGAEADKLYVDINEEAKKDRVVKDAWNRVDPAIKSAIAKNFNGKALVRRDMLDLFIGYRSASITDMWTGTSRWSGKSLNMAARAANMILGKNAYKYLGHAERALQHTTASARNFIVVRSVWIPFINATTNVVQLRMRGLPYSDIIKGISEKTAELEHYKVIERQNIQLKSKLITAKSRQERQKLENRLENNLQRIKTMSIYPMIEAGELSSLADVGDEYNDSIFTGTWADKINEEVAKIPEPIVKAGKWLSVSKDTGLYKLMEKATIYGDFIAKSIYFDKLLGEGVKLENAQRLAMEEFVNYDMMGGRTREYLENMGVLWFYNYKLRTVKIAADILLHNPASAIFAELLTPNAVLDQGTILTDNFFGKLAKGSLGGTFLPMRFFFSAWNRNPFVELLDKVI